MTFLLAIDPAAERPASNTGWALARLEPEKAFELIASGVVEGGFKGFSEAGEFHRFLNTSEIVVCERYVVYNKDGDPTPMLIEGVVRFTRPDAKLQASSILNKKGLVPDGLLKAYGVYRTAGHHKDELSAIKHALYYVLSTRHKPTLRFIRTLNY